MKRLLLILAIAATSMLASAQDELKLQQFQAEQRAAEAQIETCRVQHSEASEALGKVQAEGYRISGELARIEQQITHQRELKQRLETARAEADEATADAVDAEQAASAGPPD